MRVESDLPLARSRSDRLRRPLHQPAHPQYRRLGVRHHRAVVSHNRRAEFLWRAACGLSSGMEANRYLIVWNDPPSSDRATFGCALVA